MSKDKRKSQPKQGPPVAFRPGPDLEQLVRAFADGHKLGLNEACKSLVALAVTAMDVRYYGLIHQLAEAMGGANAFVRACVHVQGRVQGAALASRDFLLEPERSLLIIRVVREFVEGKGRQLPDMELWFTSRRVDIPEAADESEPERKKMTVGGRSRKIKRTDMRKMSDPAEQTSNEEQATDDQAMGERKEEDERPRQRQ